MAGENELKQENSELRRTQVQLASDLQEEKLLVHNLMGTIKNYEKLLRLEGQSCRQEDAVLMNEHTKRHDSWGVLCSSIVLLDEEYLELTTTVACLLGQCTKFEKLHENRSKKICNLNMRIERLDAIVFGQKVEC
jgi:hypothetical protein